MPGPDARIFVNGRELQAEKMPGGPCLEVDIAPALRPGRNVIALSSWAGRSVNLEGVRPTEEFGAVVEGFVLLDDGSFRRFGSGAGWKGTYLDADGWEQPDYDDAAWQAVRVWRNAGESILVNDSHSGGAIMRDPPYLGPIGIAFPDMPTPADTPPLFSLADGIRLDVTLPVRTGRPAPLLSGRLVDAFDRAKIVWEGEFEELEHDDTDRHYRFECKPELPGVYDLTISARENGAILDTRIEELAVIGRIPQRAVAWDKVEAETRKTLVDEIHCGDPDDPHPFIDHPGIMNLAIAKSAKPPAEPTSRVGESNGLRYRETGRAFSDWFSYAVAIKNPWKPHLVVVDYPDDREMAFTARVMEKKYVTGDRARANRMRMCRRRLVSTDRQTANRAVHGLSAIYEFC